MMLETTNIDPAKSVAKTAAKGFVIPFVMKFSFIFLILMLAVLGVMFIWFPSFFFILKYTLMAIVGLSIFIVSYSFLVGFANERIVTAIIALFISMGFVFAMRTFPFYITIALTIIILAVYLVLKTAGITRIFERSNNREVM